VGAGILRNFLPAWISASKLERADGSAAEGGGG
jgi:hypothetical protein